jgi:DNA-binding NarL/FixJ family response regulator
VSNDATALRIVVADDQRAVREALATVLDAEPGLEVVGLAADGEEAVELAHRFSPEVVLMDLRMPNVDGVTATRRLATELPDVKVVVLTTFADDASILAALEAGASGFLTKDAGREQIALAVRSAAAGQSVLDPVAQASLLRAAAPPDVGTTTTSSSSSSSSGSSGPASLPDDLTPREADVLRAIAAGHSNPEIAAELFISEVTVKSHINHLFAKIRARSRAEAVRYAYDHGLVSPPP